MDNTVTLNNSLKLSFPEGFHIMDEEEKSKLNMLGGGAGEILSDPERHMLISFGWKQLGILAKLFSEKDIVKSTESDIKKAMRPYDYESGEHVSGKIGGSNAEGFNYEYTAQGIRMFGETYAFKKDKTAYYVHLYARSELKEASISTRDEILGSAEWI